MTATVESLPKTGRVVLSLTSRGDVGEVGAIDVDVETGHSERKAASFQALELAVTFLIKKLAALNSVTG